MKMLLIIGAVFAVLTSLLNSAGDMGGVLFLLIVSAGLVGYVRLVGGRKVRRARRLLRALR